MRILLSKILNFRVFFPLRFIDANASYNGAFMLNKSTIHGAFANTFQNYTEHQFTTVIA